MSPYAGARYQQEQRLVLDAGASLLLLDAFVAGRSARGERWAFEALAARNEVEVDGRLVLADALRLGRGAAGRLEGVELLATVVALGPRLAPHAARLLEEAAAWPADPAAPVLAAASPLAGGALLRVAARGVEEGWAFVRARLGFLGALLGEDPLGRRP